MGGTDVTVGIAAAVHSDLKAAKYSDQSNVGPVIVEMGGWISARLGWAMRQAIEQHYDGRVAFLASGSLSHRFAQNGLAPEFAFKIWSPLLEKLDAQVIRMWQAGEWAAFCEMLPEYASKSHGEGFMHDTAMLLGALGWDRYAGQAEVITPYFPSSGTGQINAVFPVTQLASKNKSELNNDRLDVSNLQDPAALYAAGASRL